jgi:hypothetical protein
MLPFFYPIVGKKLCPTLDAVGSFVLPIALAADGDEN